MKVRPEAEKRRGPKQQPVIAFSFRLENQPQFDDEKKHAELQGAQRIHIKRINGGHAHQKLRAKCSMARRNVSESKIWRQMRKFGIPTRPKLCSTPETMTSKSQL